MALAVWAIPWTISWLFCVPFLSIWPPLWISYPNPLITRHSWLLLLIGNLELEPKRMAIKWIAKLYSVISRKCRFYKPLKTLWKRNSICLKVLGWNILGFLLSTWNTYKFPWLFTIDLNSEAKEYLRRGCYSSKKTWNARSKSAIMLSLMMTILKTPCCNISKYPRKSHHH